MADGLEGRDSFRGPLGQRVEGLQALVQGALQPYKVRSGVIRIWSPIRRGSVLRNAVSARSPLGPYMRAEPVGEGRLGVQDHKNDASDERGRDKV